MASGSNSVGLGSLESVELVGEGQHGRVYRADLPSKSGVVAVKILRPDLTRDEGTVKRFLETCGEVARIHDPNVARLIEARRLDAERVVVVTEFLEGKPLSVLIGEHGALDAEQFVPLARQICSGLAAAHARNVLHLDLKPENVFIVRGSDGIEQAKLLDFGAARLQTTAGSGMPSSGPVPPEQLGGKEPDARTDLYLLGLLMYRALSGRPAFELGRGTQLEVRLDTQPRPLTAPGGKTPLPPALRDLIMRCLAADPAGRPASAAEAMVVLRSLEPRGADDRLSGPVAVPDLRAGASSAITGPDVKGDTGPDSGSDQARRASIYRICPACSARYSPHVDVCRVDGVALPPPQLVIAEDDTDPVLGTTVGAYHVKRLIGAGGMGRVYLAEHVLLGRKVALKMLLPEYSLMEQAVKRFFREAQAVNRIAHENIIEITDFIEEIGGTNYYVMEYLDGFSLHALLKKKKSLPTERALAIAKQVCAALAAAHEVGIVHRDLKPENIFIVDKAGCSDFVKLLDFGIAKLVGQKQGTALTIAGSVMGTPEYMSPEQARGAKIDHRTDIYSMGAVLYNMITGTIPYEASSYSQLLIRQMTQKPRRPSTVPDLRHPISPALDALIMRCLAQEPPDRFQEMKALEAALAQLEPPAEPGPAAVVTQARASRDPAGRQQAPVGRSWALPVFIGVCLVVTAGFGIATLVRYLGSRDSAAPPVEPAKVATQPAAPSAAAKAQIRVSFASTPAGATVSRAGSRTSLGITPFTAEFEPLEQRQTFVFRLAGYDDLHKEVTLGDGHEVLAQLARLQPSQQPASKPASRPAPKPAPVRPAGRTGGEFDKGGTVDPFAE